MRVFYRISALQIRSICAIWYNKHSNLHPIIIRSYPNPSKKYDKRYGNSNIRSDLIHLHLYMHSNKQHRVCLVCALPCPTKCWQELACQFFGQEILHPHLINYLARFCETNSGTSIGSQNFGNKPNMDQNTIGNQFFCGADVGNEPNRPIVHSQCVASKSI
jgi:hypothetical protein